MKTKYFTGAGDAGDTQINNKSYKKSDPFFQLLGKIDECNSTIGVARSFAKDPQLIKWLLEVQNHLFIAQAEIASTFFNFDSNKKITSDHISFIESVIVDIDEKHDSIDSFVLPGGSKASAFCDLARTVARDSERQMVKHEKRLKISSDMLQYFNRLSSVLFALARYANAIARIIEIKPKY